MKVSGGHRTRLLLAAILVAAALLRTYGLNWDRGQHAHPDERWIAMVAPTIKWPARLQDLFDPRRSTLNPLWVPDGQGGGTIRNFAYGHLPLYLHALVGHTLAAIGERLAQLAPARQALAQELRTYGDYGGINIVGRVLSVLSDLGTICLVFLIGRDLYGERTGLLASALVALAVSHIQLAHFSTFDVMTTFFITLAVYGSIRVVQARTNTLWPTVWAGAASGLAVASKFSAVPLLAVLVVAQLIRAVHRGHDVLVDPEGQRPVLVVVKRSGARILLGLLAAGVAFAVTSPFAILDLGGYLKQIAEQSAMVRGTADWPYTRQYIGTTPFLYQIAQQVRWGLGWPLGIAAFAGLGWTVIRQFRRPRGEELVMLGWAMPYFALTSTFMVKFMRYMLPLLPLFIVMGAEMLWRISDWARERLAARSAAGDRFRLTGAVQGVLSAGPYLVVAGTMIWALLFMRVYSQEHPWIRASRWIYDHVPDGSVIAVEHWDDNLPLSLPEPMANPSAHGYVYVELPMYEPDGYDKLLLLRDRLRQADYIVLSTNRLYRTIPRLPERYPLSTRFYELLFAEELGYSKQIAFASYPGLLGLFVRDDAADESFTVYDHPKPIVYRKTCDLSDAEWQALFAEALAQPPQPNPEPKGLLSFLQREPPSEGEEKRTLLLDRPVGELPVVDDFGWNEWASGSTVGATLLWWLVVGILGWLAWPIAFVLFRGLRDRGYLLSRAVGLIVVGYLIWLPASLHWLQNGLPLTGAAIMVVALVSTLLVTRYWRELGDFMRERWRVLLIGEAVFGLAFLAFVGIRILNPDLWQPWQGGEKLMDIAYLNACLRSAYFPPYDPYFAGGYLNYYYYGQFLMSIVTRLTGIRSTVAFNLAVPTYFALTVSVAFSIGYTLAGRVLGQQKDGQRRAGFGMWHGLLAVLCVTVFGNLASATQVIDRLGWVSGSEFTSQIPGLQPLVRAAAGVWQIVAHGATFPGFNYWAPSRVVGYTINEFPYWSFLFADLHPHMMNIPFTLLVIALALNWLLSERAPVRRDLPVHTGEPPESEVALVGNSLRYVWPRLDWGLVLNWIVWPIALGALAAINTWDWPAYAGLSILIMLFTWVRGRGKQGVVPALLAGGVLAAVSLALYWPFFKYYTALYVGLGWGLSRGHTLLGEFLVVWGFALFVAVTLVGIVVARTRKGGGCLRVLRLAGRYLPRLHRFERLYHLLVRERGSLFSGVAIAALALLVLILAWRSYWVLALMVPLLALVTVLMVGRQMPDQRRFVLALVFTGFLILVGVELFYLKDHLAGDQMGWWRMNTLFKFYLQVWIMLGVAIGASLPEIWDAVQDWQFARRGLWSTAFGVLLVGVSLFAFLGTPARVIDRFPGQRPPIGTLDGLAFMRVGTYNWPDEGNPIQLAGDYDAIRWLQDHVAGTPVIVEAPVGYYREFGGRASSYTGLPAAYNDQHEREQRYGWQNSRRSSLVSDFFTTADPQHTMEVAHELDATYIYIGPLERTLYPSVRKFDQLVSSGDLSIAYQNQQVTIYQVVR